MPHKKKKKKSPAKRESRSVGVVPYSEFLLRAVLAKKQEQIAAGTDSVSPVTNGRGG